MFCHLVAPILTLCTFQGLQGPHFDSTSPPGVTVSPHPVHSLPTINNIWLGMELDSCNAPHLGKGGVYGHCPASELRVNGLWPTGTCISRPWYFWCSPVFAKSFPPMQNIKYYLTFLQGLIPQPFLSFAQSGSSWLLILLPTSLALIALTYWHPSLPVAQF